MERTQIYLTTEEAQVLDRLANERGTTRSHLIREAIDAHYVTREEELAAIRADFDAVFGLWKDRDDIPSGEIYVERIRSRPGMNYWDPLGTEEDPVRTEEDSA